MGLTLQNVPGLWLLLGVLPVVLLYVLKARRRRVKVPSVWLWTAAQRDLTARSPWQKLRRELPLVLELFALAMLALGLAAPACRGRSIPGQHVAIVLDLSGSMGARDVAANRPRIALAREAARRLVDGLALGSDAILIGAGRDARVLQPLGRDRDALRRAIDRAEPGQVEGDITAGVSLALDRLRPLGGDRRVMIVSDGATARTEELPTGPIPLQVLRVGQAQDNAGIVRMDVRTGHRGAEGEQVQVFVLVGNFGEQPREVYVTARREGEGAVLASRRLTIEPHRREPITLDFPFNAADTGRGLVVELSPDDAMGADDVAYGRIPPGLQLPVVLAARGDSPWIERALSADPDVALTHAAPDALGDVPPGALVVFDGACPATLPPDHDVLVFAPPVGRCAGVAVEAAVDAPVISSFVHTDARFRYLTMDGVHIATANPITLGAHGSELLRAGAHVLIADDSTPDREVTVVGLDVGDSDWPLRASFVLFVRNVEEIARAHRARAIAGGGRAGEPLRVAVPPGIREVRVQGPAGTQRAVVTAGTAVVGETARTGLYHLTWRDGGTLAAVNLLSDAESDLRAAPLRVANGTAATDVRSLVRPHQEIAPLLALLAALALLFDLYWVTRRERAVNKRRVRAASTAPSGEKPA